MSDASAPALVAAEAVKALDAIGTPEAGAALASYQAAEASAPPHRQSTAVAEVLKRLSGKG